jgi:hypothetical protein
MSNFTFPHFGTYEKDGTLYGRHYYRSLFNNRKSGIWWYWAPFNRNLGFWVIGNWDQIFTTNGSAWNYSGAHISWHKCIFSPFLSRPF